jgi:EAL domain-containing protein (putative c-di-GMP-specific phosphodiesterase class I)
MIELQAFDCTYGQGYLFSPPVSAEHATDLLLQNAPLFQETEQRVETVLN